MSYRFAPWCANTLADARSPTIVIAITSVRVSFNTAISFVCRSSADPQVRRTGRPEGLHHDRQRRSFYLLAAGLANLDASTGTFVRTSVNSNVDRPSSQATVQRNGILTLITPGAPAPRTETSR